MFGRSVLRGQVGVALGVVCPSRRIFRLERILERVQGVVVIFCDVEEKEGVNRKKVCEVLAGRVKNIASWRRGRDDIAAISCTRSFGPEFGVSVYLSLEGVSTYGGVWCRGLQLSRA